MKWLLWREYRLNRLILITGLVLLLLPYSIAIAVFAYCGVPVPNSRFASAIAVATLYSMILSQLTLALLGGNAIAGERADRSAEFVAYLPVSRWQRLMSKLSLAAAATVVIWGISPSVFLALAKASPDGYFPPLFGLIGYIAITGFAFFSVGWFISSVQSSPTFAVGGGLVTPLLIAMLLQAAGWLSDAQPLDHFVAIGYAVACPVVAIIAFSIGTWYFLRRVEP